MARVTGSREGLGASIRNNFGGKRRDKRDTRVRGLRPDARSSVIGKKRSSVVESQGERLCGGGSLEVARGGERIGEGRRLPPSRITLLKGGG